MKYRLMDLLACPVCKDFPLDLIVFEEFSLSGKFRWGKCEEFCGLLRKRASEVADSSCNECYRREVREGILICGRCGRWYPIIDTIPHMLPDQLRNKDEDLEFLRKYREKIPKSVLEEGKPVNLKSLG